jgi:hypothetical protein
MFLWLRSGAEESSIESVCSVRQNPETTAAVPRLEVTTFLDVDRKGEEMVAISDIGGKEVIVQKSDPSASVDNFDEVACAGILALRGISSTNARISYRLNPFCVTKVFDVISQGIAYYDACLLNPVIQNSKPWGSEVDQS